MLIKAQWIVMLLLISASACEKQQSSDDELGGAVVDKNVETVFSNVAAIKIGYMVGITDREFLLVKEAETISVLLAAIDVQETKSYPIVDMIPYGTVELTYHDGKSIRFMFFEADILYRLDAEPGPHVFQLRSDSFYKKVCQFASQSARRNIDILKRNPKSPAPQA